MVLMITGGSLKGRRITPPPQPKHGPCPTRPTTGRVRESVLNIIRSWLPNSRFMDSFAGSGIMGFEAISQGASHVLAIEANPKQHQLIQTNATALGLIAPQYESRCQKLEVLLAQPNNTLPYDIAYWDAPYELYATLQLDRMVMDALTQGWLKKNSRVLIEHSPQWRYPSHWAFSDERQYGDTVVSFLALDDLTLGAE